MYTAKGNLQIRFTEETGLIQIDFYENTLVNYTATEFWISSLNKNVDGVLRNMVGRVYRRILYIQMSHRIMVHT